MNNLANGEVVITPVKYSTDEYESFCTAKLNEALAKASAEFPLISPNRENIFIGTLYSDLDEIMKVVRPILAKYGIIVSTQEREINDVPLLITRLRHLSGQWIETRTRINPIKNDINSWGSYIIKKRRFQVMNLLNLTIAHDRFDDDGEQDAEESKKLAASGTKLTALYRKKTASADYINQKEYDILMDMLDDLPGYVKDIQESLNITTLRNMPKSLYPPTIQRINHEIDKRKRM